LFMPAHLGIALAAGVGGVAPSLIHLAQGFIRPMPDVPGPFYFVGVAIFFALGALVAFVFAETNARKAFFLGIGLPALVATAQTQGVAKSVVAALVPSAHAQARVPVIRTPRPLTPSLTFKPRTDCKGCELWFANSSGKIISKQILASPLTTQKISLPKEATTFGIADPKSNFKLLRVPEESSTPIIVEFDRKYSPLKDLRRGLGDYDLKAYDPNVTWNIPTEK
jgi:hypothetical protein